MKDSQGYGKFHVDEPKESPLPSLDIEASTRRFLDRYRRRAVFLAVIIGALVITTVSGAFLAGRHLYAVDPDFASAKELGIFQAVGERVTVGNWRVWVDAVMPMATGTVVLFRTSAIDQPDTAGDPDRSLEVSLSDDKSTVYESLGAEGRRQGNEYSYLKRFTAGSEGVTRLTLTFRDLTLGQTASVQVDLRRSASHEFRRVLYPGVVHRAGEAEIELERVIAGTLETTADFLIRVPTDGDVAGAGIGERVLPQNRLGLPWSADYQGPDVLDASLVAVAEADDVHAQARPKLQKVVLVDGHNGARIVETIRTMRPAERPGEWRMSLVFNGAISGFAPIRFEFPDVFVFRYVPARVTLHYGGTEELIINKKVHLAGLDVVLRRLVVRGDTQLVYGVYRDGQPVTNDQLVTFALFDPRLPGGPTATWDPVNEEYVYTKSSPQMVPRIGLPIGTAGEHRVVSFANLVPTPGDLTLYVTAIGTNVGPVVIEVDARK